mgnify:CR=1 FL=1
MHQSGRCSHTVFVFNVGISPSTEKQFCHLNITYVKRRMLARATNLYEQSKSELRRTSLQHSSTSSNKEMSIHTSRYSKRQCRSAQLVPYIWVNTSVKHLLNSIWKRMKELSLAMGVILTRATTTVKQLLLTMISVCCQVQELCT